METKSMREYNILLFSLKEKVHEFRYKISKEFFKHYENSLVEDGDFEVIATLNKSESLLQFEFKIKGNAHLICDRSLESFTFPIEKTSKILFKYGENYEEISDDVIILEHGTSELNIAQWIYELIAVEIPYKKLHPKYNIEEEEDEDEDDSNIQLVYTDVIEEDSGEESGDENEVWENLKKKFNKE